MWNLFETRLWNDERGSGTVWGLVWFSLFVGICGLSVDVTNGFRARTMLQSTADASALAGAIDLPVKSTAVATAVNYSSQNMDSNVSGTVLEPSDVLVGRWDNASKTLDTGSLLPDAVMVTVYQANQNNNPMPANFLRIMGLMEWNVKAQAVAQRFIPDCLKDGLVARGIVNMSSNNGFYNKICIHGQQGVDIQSNNYFEPGVNVSMPSLSMLKTPNSSMTSNTGLQSALRESNLDPRMVNHVDEIMLGFLDPNWANQKSFIDKSKPVIVVDEKFDLSTALPGRIYHVQCQANKNASIPSNTMVHDVVIIAECEIKIGSGAFVYNAVLGSRSGGNPGNGTGGGVSSANIGIAANTQIGMPDNCDPANGVTLLSNATIHTSSSTGLDGVQIVAAGDIELGARDQGINGINVQAGGNITLTANNEFGLCATGAPDLLTVNYYRLVL